MKAKTNKLTMDKVMNNPKNGEFHVLVINGKLFKARTGEGFSYSPWSIILS